MLLQQFLSLQLFLLLLELGVNDVAVFEVVLLTDDVDQGALACLSLLRHQNGFFDLFTLVNLKDLKPVKKGLG